MQMRRLPFLLLFLFSCVGEDVVMDVVDPEVRITNPINNLEINTSYTFEYMYLDNAGMSATPDQVSWSTSDANIAIVNDQGEATALALGDVTLTLTASVDGESVEATIDFTVSEDSGSSGPNERSGTVNTTTSYDLSGNFTISIVDNDDLRISFADNYVADDDLPGLYVYLTNNPNSPSGGYEIGPVNVFSGAHSYTIPDTDLFDYNYIFYYCKPFNVKVGHGEIE